MTPAPEWATILVELQCLPTVSAVSRFLTKHATKFGFPTHVIAPVPTEEYPVSDGAFLVQNWPPEWDEAYRVGGFAAFDPVPRVAPLIIKPVSIADIYAGRAGLIPDPRAERILAYARSLGRGEGVLVPIFGPLGYRAIVCFAGPGPLPGPEGMALLQVLATFAHNRVRELAQQTRDKPTLTAREIDVLRCARDGLSDNEAAKKLQISVRTIRFHFANARHKLDASTRGQAVAVAVQMGLL